MKKAIKKFLQDTHFFPLVEATMDLGKLLRYQVHRRFGAVDRLTFPVKSDDNEEEMCYGRVDLMTEME
jgi:hypothetical protein